MEVTNVDEIITYENIHNSKVVIDGNIIELDNDCINSILLLNAKGYYTTDCCSGHTKAKRNNTKFYPYIGFDENHLPPNFPSFIDKIGTYGDNLDKKAIYFSLPTNPKEEDIKLLWERIFQWVYSLPYNKEILWEYK